jgi:hypothetical protein
MRKIKGSSSHLKSQVRNNLAKATVSVIVFVFLLSILMYHAITTLQFGTVEELGIILLFVPIIAFYYYLRRYHLYSGGLLGEKNVIKTLEKNLGDEYYLINDLYPHTGGGDIDHIVLGPNGIFVLETKNWSGGIVCHGDQWQRTKRRDFQSSPSRQVRRNVAKIRQTIDNTTELRNLNVWVEGIVVFTSNHANLTLHNPTATVLKLSQLTDYIKSFKGNNQFSREQLEIIGKEIIKLK